MSLPCLELHASELAGAVLQHKDPKVSVRCCLLTFEFADQALSKAFPEEAINCEQVGCAADVEDEALQLVDHLQSRLRKIVGQVAASPSRPKVLSLEGLQPLVLGQYTYTFSCCLPESLFVLYLSSSGSIIVQVCMTLS